MLPFPPQLLPYILAGITAIYGGQSIAHVVKAGAAKAKAAIWHVVKDGLKSHPAPEPPAPPAPEVPAPDPAPAAAEEDPCPIPFQIDQAPLIPTDPAQQN